jgi:cytochrome c oxidase subunit 4
MANDNHEHGGHEHSATPYYVTVVLLFALTILTYTCAQYFHLGAAAFPVAMLIAVTKGSLVVLFFMHLKDQRGASRLTLVIAILFVLLLISLVIADLNTRFPLALPPGSFRFHH